MFVLLPLQWFSQRDSISRLPKLRCRLPSDITGPCQRSTYLAARAGPRRCLIALLWGPIPLPHPLRRDRRRRHSLLEEVGTNTLVWDISRCTPGIFRCWTGFVDVRLARQRSSLMFLSFRCRCVKKSPFFMLPESFSDNSFSLRHFLRVFTFKLKWIMWLRERSSYHFLKPRRLFYIWWMCSRKVSTISPNSQIPMGYFYNSKVILYKKKLFLILQVKVYLWCTWHLSSWI